MYLRRIQWKLQIIFILFVFNQFQFVSCIHCGKFGFSCINERFYRKCDVYKKSYVDNFVNLCPKYTFCNEECKRACTSINIGNSRNDEIKDIISTDFSTKHLSLTQSASFSCPSTTTMKTKSCQTSSSPSKGKSKNLKKSPSPIHADKTAFSKNGKCKANSTKHAKNKHARDVWNIDYNEPISKIEDLEKYSNKNEMKSKKLKNDLKLGSSFMNDATDYNDLFVNSDSNSEKNRNSYNKNSRYRTGNNNNNNNIINNYDDDSYNNDNKQFICPSVGSFPIESNDTCFYVCYKRTRSAYGDLKAVKVCCPKSMFFNKQSHRCEYRISKYTNRNIDWRRRRLRNRKFHRERTYDRNKVIK